jgi:hypothetical protein
VIVAGVALALALYFFDMPTPSVPGATRQQVELDHIYVQQGTGSAPVDICLLNPLNLATCSTPHDTSSTVRIAVNFTNPSTNGNPLTLTAVTISSPFMISPSNLHLSIPSGVKEAIDFYVTMPAEGGHYSPSISVQTG